jgi:Phasin protein
VNLFAQGAGLGFGPLETSLRMMSSSGTGQIEQTVMAFQPFCKGMARWQLELLSYGSRRAHAAFELPQRLTRCRTFHEVAAEQARYLEVAAQQSAETAQRLASIWMGMAAMPQMPRSKTAQRDYIRLPESASAPEAGSTGRSGSSPWRPRAA